MAQPTRLQKIIVSIIIFAVGIFFIWSDTNKIKIDNVENKAKDVVSSYIDTQKNLEDDGYNFTFNFNKTESNIKKSGALNKEESNKDFKIDGKPFGEDIWARIVKAHSLAYDIKSTIEESNTNGEYKLTKESISKIKQDCKKLKQIFSQDILAEKFPEEYQPVKAKFKEKETSLENELDLIVDKVDKMDSDEMLSSIRIMGNFIRTCEECSSNK